MKYIYLKILFLLFIVTSGGCVHYGPYRSYQGRFVDSVSHQALILEYEYASISNPDSKVLEQYEQMLNVNEEEIKQLNKSIIQLRDKLESANEINSLQTTTIEEQLKIISQQEAELNKRYLLFVYKNELQLRQYNGQRIKLPYRKNRIKILKYASKDCNVQSTSNNDVIISIKEDYWEDNKFLVIYIGSRV